MTLQKKVFPPRTQEELYKFKHDDTIRIKTKLRLIPWVFKSIIKTIFKRCEEKYYKIKNKIILNLSPAKRNKNSQLKIWIGIHGGLGDTVMYAVTIKELYKYIDCDWRLDIAVFAKNRRYLNEVIFSGYNFEVNFFDKKERVRDGTTYDAIISIDRFFNIEYLNHDRAKLLSEKFLYFCEQACKCYAEHIYMVTNAPRYHTLIQKWSELIGQKRFQQPDPYGMLGIDQSTKWFLNLADKYYTAVEKSETFKFVLESQYVTLQCGVNLDKSTAQGTRIWLRKRYEVFLEKIHKKFPNIKVVQLGCAYKNYSPLKGVDVDLSGKTSFEELAVIMKHSLFHIDGECGLVHLKHALNGRSIVLFGPTSHRVLGYDNNINIVGDGCSGWCEWVTAKWDTHCPRGFAEPPCMASIMPDTVFRAAEQMIDSLPKYSYQYFSKNVDDVADFINTNVQDLDATIVDVFNKNGWKLAINLRAKYSNITIFRNDYEPHAFEFAKIRNISAEYGCLYNLAMDDDSCNVVIWQNGETPPQHLFYAFKELMRILRPGGYLIISGVRFPDDIASKFGLDGCEAETYILSKKIV